MLLANEDAFCDQEELDEKMDEALGSGLNGTALLCLFLVLLFCAALIAVQLWWRPSLAG